MTRPTTTDLTITDRCTRCPDVPAVHPDGKGVRTEGGGTILTFVCEAGHAWERTFTRGAIKKGSTKATSARRRHLADRPVTTTTAPTTITTGNTAPDHEDDCTERTGTDTGRTPAPATGRSPHPPAMASPVTVPTPRGPGAPRHPAMALRRSGGQWADAGWGVSGKAKVDPDQHRLFLRPESAFRANR
jgi:hypothetical protein